MTGAPLNRKARRRQKSSGSSTAVLLANANQLFRANKLSEAGALCLQILSADAQNFRALYLLGQIVRQQGDLERAIVLIRDALVHQQQNAAMLYELGSLLRQTGRPPHAETYLKRALAADDRMGIAHLELGALYLDLRRFSESQKELELAVKYLPKPAAAFVMLSRLHHQLDDGENAIAMAQKALELDPQNIDAYARLGDAQGLMGNQTETVKAFDMALNLAPDDRFVRLSYAQWLAYFGRIDDAIAHCRTLVQQYPSFVPAYCKLAQLEKNPVSDDDLNAMKSLLQQGKVHVMDQISLQFSLSEMLERRRDYAGAAEHMIEANRIKRENISYSPEESEALVADMKAAFPTIMTGALTDQAELTPIFVVGMPRSGTSLTEQILASHPEVAGAGELSEIGRLVKEFCTRHNLENITQMMAHISSEQLRELGNEYREFVRRYAGESSFVVDKMPANFRYLGLIMRMLPDAKIIHCTRNPLDTCLSIFKKFFGPGALHYAYDMAELGHYYKLYQSLMAHWHQIMPGQIYDLPYENIVGAQVPETQKLLAFCGLEWADACEKFYDTDRLVRTASMTQVREPIHAKSVGIADKYGAVLQPLRDALEI